MLDVLTNGIGALLLLMLIFVRMMGEPVALAEGHPLATTVACSAPILVLSATTGLIERPIRWSLRLGGAAHRPVQFNPAKESMLEIARSLTAAGVIEPKDPLLLSYNETGFLRLVVPVRDGTTLELEAFPEDGPIDPHAKLQAEIFVAGARLRRTNSGTNDARFELRADWLDDAAAGVPGETIFRTSDELPLASAASGESTQLHLSISLAARKLKECH
jgi:hypothetical protein